MSLENLTDNQRRVIVDSMSLNLDYQIYESFTTDEYSPEIEGEILVLRLIGENELADRYQKDFEEELAKDEEE